MIELKTVEPDYVKLDQDEQKALLKDLEELKGGKVISATLTNYLDGTMIICHTKYENEHNFAVQIIKVLAKYPSYQDTLDFNSPDWGFETYYRDQYETSDPKYKNDHQFLLCFDD